ncbi:MAG: EAL domain-containing protein [Methylococcaceae bacterium]|jgi:diguanylate cyclase (GGDEF)-like protein/PAS domain S-box-containing protein
MAFKGRILIVDDTVASLKLATDLLKDEGYQVLSAISGELALKAAIRNPPELVLLDIMMSGMDGFEVCTRLKSHPNTSNLPIIFVSALPDTREKVRGFGLGAVDFVTKPYQREELLARVKTHLEVYRLRNHLEKMVESRSSKLMESEVKLKTSLDNFISANAQLRTLLNTIPDLVWLKDPEGVFLACNFQFERLLGAKEAEIVGKTDYDFVNKELADFYRENDRLAMVNGKASANEEWITFAENGYRGLFETIKTPMFDRMGTFIGVLGISREITERHAAEEKIQRHMRFYAALNECNKAIVHCTDETDLFMKICQSAVLLCSMKTAWVGLTNPETQMLIPVGCFGAGLADLQNIQISTAGDSPFGNGPSSIAIREQRPVWCQDTMNDPITEPWHVLNLDNDWVASASLPLTRNGNVVGALILYAGKANAFDAEKRDLLIGMARDISFALDNFSREMARRQAESEITRLAFYDSLTNLPNRRLLFERLQQSLAESQRNGQYGAVMFIDLDGFKTLNDTKGHCIGDLLLLEVANRLHASLREGDTIARLGGDEFIVILNELGGHARLAAVKAEVAGNKILEAISQPYILHGYEHFCSASMGIELFNNHDRTVEELLKFTDIAMYHAKRAKRNSLLFFDPAMQAELEKRMATEKDLRCALEENQFKIYYQMQVDGNRHIIGAEALIRWQHPHRGLTLPVEFIHIAEETNLILPIGKWVLEVACDQLHSWHSQQNTCQLQLAVNVSAAQFHQQDFVRQIHQILSHHPLNPNRLKLELTESLVLENIGDTIIKMQQLREMGVSFSLDDFGTGYSSLNYLTKLPFDQLKIDQSFVRNINKQKSDAIIVQTIIGMANNLGIESIAEGVETEEQYTFLSQHGCNLYQGFLFGRPVPLEQFETSCFS